MDTTTEDQPLDITPAAETVNLMDPYELFSTPPNEMILSSTPTKQTKGRKRDLIAPSSARKAVLKRNLNNARASISFDHGRHRKAPNVDQSDESEEEYRPSNVSTSSAKKAPIEAKSTRVLRNRNLNRSARQQILSSKGNATVSDTKLNTSLSKTNNNKRAPRRQKQQQSNNLWDKCLKSNPELAQFVDEFNHSLEEALSKPLDISKDD